MNDCLLLFPTSTMSSELDNAEKAPSFIPVVVLTILLNFYKACLLVTYSDSS